MLRLVFYTSWYGPSLCAAFTSTYQEPGAHTIHVGMKYSNEAESGFSVIWEAKHRLLSNAFNKKWAGLLVYYELQNIE